MNGAIDVESEAGVGSSFWFTIPVKVHESTESQKVTISHPKDFVPSTTKIIFPFQEELALAHLKAQLRQVKILVKSPAETTSALLRTMLSGLNISSVSSISELFEFLSRSPSPPVDFIVIDHQSEVQVDEIARRLQAIPGQSECRIIHLYTPTSSSLSGVPLWATASPRVIRSHKPPRAIRLLQLLASLKGISTDIQSSKSSEVSQALKDLSAAKRTLYGNVLIAEGIVFCNAIAIGSIRLTLTVYPRQSSCSTVTGEAATAVSIECDTNFKRRRGSCGMGGSRTGLL
jgi:hypothetical protein